jgi:GTP diphosphokinase / guanosine-3',5'-bis(diphosphate) 3'-diphosphatase
LRKQQETGSRTASGIHRTASDDPHPRDPREDRNLSFAPDQALIQKAYVFSAAAHAGQVRLSGEAYLSHPLEVANILASHDLDASTIAAGLLHDTVEDSGVAVEEIKEQFGDEVAAIVDGVTKIGKMSFTSKEEAQAENIRKMILAMAEDIRVILVKLADRLHNMRTLEYQKPFKQQLVGQETLEIYAPLANRLGSTTSRPSSRTWPSST